MPDFLREEDVIEIHRDGIERYGGDLALRDRGLLQSAIAMPQAMFGGQYLHANIYEMAAAYVFHIAMNHPFLDGNKRAGSASAIVFLEMNGIQLAEECEMALVDLVLDVTAGKVGKPGIAEFFRKHAVLDNRFNGKGH
ncbi:MAG TPA: type II toxin-antitoxin system death-on-curing family toxin [Planctomycetota bacterium]|nr:type II toxin-antitoxin system death-on-curing family toxin [Planctomycetota bacterium]